MAWGRRLGIFLLVGLNVHENISGPEPAYEMKKQAPGGLGAPSFRQEVQGNSQGDEQIIEVHGFPQITTTHNCAIRGEEAKLTKEGLERSLCYRAPTSDGAALYSQMLEAPGCSASSASHPGCLASIGTWQHADRTSSTSNYCPSSSSRTAATATSLRQLCY